MSGALPLIWCSSAPLSWGMPPRPACGERAGVRGIQLSQNFLQHSISLYKRIIIPESNHPETFRLKMSGSFCVAGRLLGMLPAVQFYYQLLLKANEICDVRWNRMLSPKLEAGEVAIL